VWQTLQITPSLANQKWSNWKISVQSLETANKQTKNELGIL
jgi:hypothetical protein